MKFIALCLPLLLIACGEKPAATSESQRDTAPAPTAAATDPAPALAIATAAPAIPAAFRTCATCHSLVEGKNGIGPSLHGVMGRVAGSAPGYAYSSALKNSGITWDDASLETWLQGPSKMVPGTKMTTMTANADARKEIREFLRSQ